MTEDLKLKRIIKGLENSYGEEFFDKIVLNMSLALDLDYVLIAVPDSNRLVANTIALAAHGKIVDNFEYELKHTPCENVVCGKLECYPEKVTDYFPQDQLLVDMNIESYLGSSLRDSKGDVIGIIVGMGETTIENKELIITLFRIFSGRISAEIERTQQSAFIEYLAHHNSLTKLYNTTYLEKQLAIDSDKTVLVLNVNNFSYINSSYGFDMGDELLCQIANTLPEVINGATCFHTGSDEFTLLFDSGDIDIKETILTLKNYFSSNKITLLGTDINISFNYGDASGNVSVLMQATSALKKSKKLGVNVYHIYNHEEDSVSEKERESFMYYNNLLRKSLANGHVIPLFQGIHNNKTKKITKYEALVRIEHEDKMISPYFFLEPTKLSGLLPEITKVMIDKSFAIMSKFRENFSINITEDDLNQDYLADYIKIAAKTHNISLNRVILEVLEGITPFGKDRSQLQLNYLKKLGCKLAIDDFGSEYSNFERLLDLDVDYIKIDGKYVKDIHTDTKCYNIVSAIVFFAKSANIQCIAEHVDCKEVQQVIEDLGVEYSQGYYFSKPHVID